MISFLTTIISVIVVIVFCFKIYKEYKESQTVDEKAWIIIIIFIFAFPLVLFYIDFLNLGSSLKWIKNVNEGNRWFQFLTAYFSSIIGALIGATALILMNIRQMESERERNKEDKRIENMPILNYKFDDKHVNCRYLHTVSLKETGNIYETYFHLENIGLNHAKNVNIVFFVDDEKDNNILLDKHELFLKRDMTIVIKTLFNLDIKKGNVRNVIILINYNDLLNNEYEQSIKASLVYDEKENTFRVQDVNIENERLVKTNR